MQYRIIYVEDVEFGSLSHDFQASGDKEAQEKAKDEIEILKRQHREDILIRELQRVEPVSKMTERIIHIPF